MAKIIPSDKSLVTLKSPELSKDEKVKMFIAVEYEAQCFRTFEKYLIEHKIVNFELQLY